MCDLAENHPTERYTFPSTGLQADRASTTLERIQKGLLDLHHKLVLVFVRESVSVVPKAIQIATLGNRASILFASHEEALRAYQSPESMFGNRFVKIFWDSNQQVSEEILQRENSRLEMAEMRREQLKNKEIVAQKEKLLLQQIEQQRILMQQLQAKDISEESKTELLSSLNKVTMLIQPSAAEFQPRKRQFSNEMSISPAAANPPSKRALSLDFRPKALTLDCLPEGKTMTDISVMLQRWFPLCSSFGERGMLLEFGERFQAEGALSQLKATFPESTIVWKA